MIKSPYMEFRKFINQLRKSIHIIIIYILLFGILGGASYFLIPANHITTGSLFILRQINPQAQNRFAYEDYYSQQVAQDLTNSIVTIIKSEEIKTQTLMALDIPVTEKSLRKLGNQMSVRKTGPQVITIIIKDKNPEESQKIWQLIVNRSSNIVNGINRGEDSKISVNKFSEVPVTNEQFHNIWVNTSMGLLFGTVVTIFLLSMKIYFREK